MSLLAQTLHDRGHEVTWWCSTYDHEGKSHRFDRYTELRVAPGYDLHLLHGRRYRRNISIQRLRNHHEVAVNFLKEARGRNSPDLIVVTVPTIELANAATQFAAERGLPLVIDIRDQHPDIYLALLPSLFRGLGRLILRPLYSKVDAALRRATAITATSQFFLNWGLARAGRAQRDEDKVFPLAYPALRDDGRSSAVVGERFRILGLNSQRRIIWYVGTFNRWIDLGTPIAAARELHKEGNEDIQFVFSGDGDYSKEWHRLASGLPNVVFTGWVRESEIAYIRSVAWAGLAPYRAGFTTMGNKLFEFMSGGLPILSSLTGEPRTILQNLNAGLPYEAGNEKSLIRAIERLLEQPGLHAEISGAGRAAYEREFRAEAVYPKMAAYLERVAREADAQPIAEGER
jgi:glycosyltransferase involved in cell wall biosynthesis